jgi:hypothetical protein
VKRDLGVRISDNCALVLIDYQPELFEFDPLEEPRI